MNEYFVLLDWSRTCEPTRVYLCDRRDRAFRTIMQFTTRAPQDVYRCAEIVAYHCVEWGAAPLLQNDDTLEREIADRVALLLGNWQPPSLPYCVQQPTRIRQL